MNYTLQCGLQNSFCFLQFLYTVRRLAGLRTIASIRTFWVACLLVFFGFLWKSTLLSESSTKAKMIPALCLGKVKVADDKSEIIFNDTSQCNSIHSMSVVSPTCQYNA